LKSRKREKTEGNLVFLTHKSFLPCAEAHKDIVKFLLQVIPDISEGLGYGVDGDSVWSFVLRTSCSRLVDFGGKVARFDSISTARRCFIPGALPLANTVYGTEKSMINPYFCPA
jgi:hypothetical protein